MRRLVLPAVCLSLAVTTAGAQRDSAFAWSKRLPDGARLTIRNLNGPIDVRATSGAQVQVHASVRAEGRGNVRDADFEVREISASEVEICSVYLKRSACDRQSGYDSWNNDRVSVRYTIEVPKSLHLVANTGNGDVTITQTAADVDGQTGNGDVTIKETTGRIVARTGNGDVNITGAQGSVKANTGNGAITASVRGSLEAQSGNGDVDIKLASIPADATSMSFTTGLGNVHVTLPADFNGEVDANSGAGGITSDFDIRTTGRMNPFRIRGTVGTGRGPLLKVRTGNGQLTLRKG